MTLRNIHRTIMMLFAFLIVFSQVLAGDINTVGLDDLVGEALNKSPELLVSETRVSASLYRVPQAQSLPDPMFMFGYQNEGFQRITIGEEPNSMGMFALSQMFPFWGKRDLKGQMAARDADNLRWTHRAAQLKVVATVRQLYYELFLAYKNIDVLKKLSDYFSMIEDAASARYASGTGSQQEIVMAQTEKYMLIEREEMQRQRIQAIQGMLNNTLGRDITTPLSRPAEFSSTPYELSLEESLEMAKKNSPEIHAKQAMADAAEAKVQMAKKEYYPDPTLGVSYFPKTKGMLDMWNVTVSVNIPLYSTTKQSQAVLEAEANRLGAKREIASLEYMLSSGIRDSFSMVKTSEKLMKLYKEGVIPKTYQDFQLALSGYTAGKIEAITAISRLKALLDTELLYWAQYVQREKAVALLDMVTGRNSGKWGIRDSKPASNMIRHDPGKVPHE